MPVVCTTGDIRLVGGTNSLEGRVEVCSSNQWGTVCDDSWGVTDAGVACRQLGFLSAGIGLFWDGCLLHVLSADYELHFLPTGATALSSATFGQGTGPILLDDVACSGSETRLLDCPNSGIGVNNCFHSEDAGVRCQSTYNFLINQNKVLCYGSVLMILTHSLVVQPPVSSL